MMNYIQIYHSNASLLAESLEVIQQTASVILKMTDCFARYVSAAE